MIYQRDLQECGVNSIEEYFMLIINGYEIKADTIMQIYKDLSKKQEADFWDWVVQNYGEFKLARLFEYFTNN